MIEAFKVEPIGKYISIQGGYAYKSNDFVNSGVPVLKIKNIKAHEVDTSEVVFVSEDIARKTANYYVQPEDILISMTGSGIHAPDSMVGRIARYIGPGNRFLINQRVGRFVITKPSELDARYLFFVLSQPEYQWQLVSIATGSANQVNISGKQIESLIIPIPPISLQRQIAETLSEIDDKIELNHRMNETLESLARAIFKSWFVDFDPVCAKLEIRHPYSMDAETASLFPDSFENSALGEIPKGWDIKPIDQVADFLNGLALQKYPPEGNEYLPVIKIAELRRGISETSGMASPNIEKKYIVEDGDVLFSWSGSLEVIIWCGGKGALNQHLFKVTSAKYPKWFYYQWIKYHLPEFQAIAAGKATTMGHIQRHHLSAAYTVIPPEKTFDRMDQIMAPILDLIINNEKESHTLTTIRDTLLPKLLSGKIRVKDAENVTMARI